MGAKYQFKDEKEAREDKIESSNLDRRKTKLKINAKLIGPKIEKIIETKNEYQDANDNKYIKTEQGDLLILYYSDAKKELDIMAIDNFQEGDYGLWLNRPAPYYLKQGQIIEYASEKEDSKGAVLGLKENKYLQQEERIKNNFLWIYRGNQTSNLQVVSGHNAKVCGNLIANIMDYKPMTNIMPFGNCQTTSNPQVAAATSANGGVLAPQPCVPNIPAPWAKVKKDVKVGQQAALLEGSLLTCAYGGQIELVDPGQSILQE